MGKRKLGPFTVHPVGLGCMNLSHAYGIPPSEADAIKVLDRAIDLGVDHFDTAALYGFGSNERLIGKWIAPHRDRIVLASKCGMQGVDGKRVIDGRPETLSATLDSALLRLGVDEIDLYYLHRFDKLNQVPIEESVGALSEMVRAGKIKTIGLSEVSGETLLKAHDVHPITAVQSEYSLWSRNAEIGVLDACQEVGASFVAFSPLARGFLADMALEPGAFVDRDIRRNMPRFKPEAFDKNRPLREAFSQLAEQAQMIPSQLALAWLLHKAPHIHLIPGTTSTDHLEENTAAAELNISQSIFDAADALINQNTVFGARYPPGTQAEIDTEEFA